MKKAILSSAVAAALLGSATGALAEGYVGLDYQMYTFSASGADDMEPQSMVLKLGGSLGQYAKVETRFGRSVADDNANGTDLKIDEIIGFYVKGGMDVMDLVFPYAVIGYSKVDFEFHDQPDQTESDVSYGVGADFHFGDMQVGVEWMMMQDKTDYELEVVSLSGAWRF